MAIGAVATPKGAEMRDEFMTLLLAQLRNQDPLSPVQQQDFVGQLAQFSTLEGVEAMNDNFRELLEFQTRLAEREQFLQAAEMVGDTVSYRIAASSDGTTVLRTGEVNRVSSSGGQVWLEVGGDTIALDQILGVERSMESQLALQSAAPVGSQTASGVNSATAGAEESNALLTALRELLS